MKHQSAWALHAPYCGIQTGINHMNVLKCHIVIDPELATKVGLEEAIILNHIHQCVELEKNDPDRTLIKIQHSPNIVVLDCVWLNQVAWPWWKPEYIAAINTRLVEAGILKKHDMFFGEEGNHFVVEINYDALNNIK